MKIRFVLQTFIFDDGKVIGKIDITLSLEEMCVLTALSIRTQHDCQILYARIVVQVAFLYSAGLECITQAGYGEIAAIFS